MKGFKIFLLLLVLVMGSLSIGSAFGVDYELAQQDTTNSGPLSFISFFYNFGTFTTNSSGYDLGAVEVLLSKTGTPPSSTITAYIAQMSGTSAGTVIATSTNTFTSSQIGSVAWFNFSFSSVSLNPSTTYAIVIGTNVKSTSGNYIAVHYSGIAGSRGSGDNLGNIPQTSATQRLSHKIYALTVSTPEIQHNVQPYYNTENISIQLNTSTNTNMSYYLDLGSEVAICSDCNNSVLNLSGLSEGTHSILFVSEDDNGQVNTSANFTIDLTAPTITQIGNVSENTFEIDFSTIISVNDTNPDTCVINITELENVSTPDNFLIDCTDTQVFSTAGLHNGLVTATDLAGNTDTYSFNFTINPFIFVFFEQQNGSTVLIYNATVYHPDGRIETPDINTDGSFNLSPLDTDDGALDLGVHTITFSKLGFQTENFTLNITDSSAGQNITFNVSASEIRVFVYDRETGELVNGTTTLTLVATIGYNTTTTTGAANISDINFLAERYQLIVSNPDYYSESVFFDYNNQEILNVNTYLLKLNSTDFGVITIQAISDTGYRISGAICSALEWKPELSAYQSVAQGLTNINGETILNIEIGSKLYKFFCSKDDNSAFSTAGIIQNTGTTLPIILETTILTPSDIFAGFSYTLVNTTFNSSHDRVTFTFTDTNNLVNQACLKSYRVVGINRNLLNENCLNSSTGQIQQVYSINNSYNLVVEGSVFVSGSEYIIDSITYKGQGALATGLKEWHLDLILPLVFTIIGISIGFSLKPQNIYISEIGVIVMVWLAVAIVPTVLSTSVAVFVSLIAILMLWGGHRNK